MHISRDMNSDSEMIMSNGLESDGPDPKPKNWVTLGDHTRHEPLLIPRTMTVGSHSISSSLNSFGHDPLTVCNKVSEGDTVLTSGLLFPVLWSQTGAIKWLDCFESGSP